MDKKVIGRKERITLPDLGLRSVWAKIDTGAYTSSIHAENIREEVEKGQNILKFEILMPGHPKFNGTTLSFQNYRQKIVKNSFGQSETRYLVVTRIKIAGEIFPAEFTLSDRSSMKNSILLGRKILRDKFLVDVSKINLSKAFRKNP